MTANWRRKSHLKDAGSTFSRPKTWREVTHRCGFWLGVSFFSHLNKTSFAILIGRIILFHSEISLRGLGNIYVIHRLRGPYWEKLCPRSWRPRAVLRPRTLFLPMRTDLGRWIAFLFFFNWDLKVSGNFFFTLQPMCVEGGLVRVDEGSDRLQTKTKHYNMIFRSVTYIITLTALF